MLLLPPSQTSFPSTKQKEGGLHTAIDCSDINSEGNRMTHGTKDIERDCYEKQTNKQNTQPPKNEGREFGT